MRSAFGKVVKAGYYCYTADNIGYAEAGSRTRTMEFFQGGIGVMETPPDRRDFRKSGGLFTSITPSLEAVASRKLSKAQGFKP